MKMPENLTMVIFGASGDLTHRKLMPALYWLYKNGRTPTGFLILGTARTLHTDASYRTSIKQGIIANSTDEPVDEGVLEGFLQRVFYHEMNPSSKADYTGLAERLNKLDNQWNSEGNYLYYLATPPALYGVIPLCLQSVGLHQGAGIRRIVVEKPFGYDYKSACELNKIYASVFQENQVFRIDHFLGKETVQNILALRFANTIFEPLWNKDYIDCVEVTAVEKLGVENRGAFFDDTGTLRDMVQNHLIQLVAITAMEVPKDFTSENFRNEVLKVYRSLTPLSEEEIAEQVIRGQYMESEHSRGYRQEKNIDPLSRTETFLAMKVNISNPRWEGVPFYIRTGKRMPTKVTEIVVRFKKSPFHVFGCADNENCPPADSLIIRIQPNEGIVLRFALKVPGAGFKVKMVDMDFSYSDWGTGPTPDAYSRLIEDCMLGDATLFTRADAVKASWKYFSPILEYWKSHPETPLYGYPSGTWGPVEADALIMADEGRKWTNPCKNLTNTHLYCEL